MYVALLCRGEVGGAGIDDARAVADRVEELHEWRLGPVQLAQQQWRGRAQRVAHALQREQLGPLDVELDEVRRLAALLAHELIERHRLHFDRRRRVASPVIPFDSTLDVQRVKRGPRRDEQLGSPRGRGQRLLHDGDVLQAVDREVVAQRRGVGRHRLEGVDLPLRPDQPGTQDREEADVRADVVDHLPGLDKLLERPLHVRLGSPRQVAQRRAAKIDARAGQPASKNAHVAMAHGSGDELHRRLAPPSAVLDPGHKAPARSQDPSAEPRQRAPQTASSWGLRAQGCQHTTRRTGPAQPQSVSAIDTFRAGAEWVSSPIEIHRTPVCARERSVASVTPPLASSSARPATWATASRSWDSSMLSSNSRGAPAASACSISSRFLTSTCSVCASPGAPARADATACAMPPAAAMWFSLMRIASCRPILWFDAPPAATAAFSSARRPGVVLRVSRTPAPVPCTSRTARAASVATPERCPRKFSAVRSAVRSAAAAARTDSTEPPRSRHSPSCTSDSMSASASSSAKAVRAACRP